MIFTIIKAIMFNLLNILGLYGIAAITYVVKLFEKI